MSSFDKLLKNTAIFAISSFASKFLVFLLLPFYTRVLSASEFGTGDLVITSVSLIIPIFTLCVSEGALRFALDNKRDKKNIFTFGLGVIFGGFVLLLLLYPILNTVEAIREYLSYFYAIYLATSLNQYFNQFLRGIEKIRLIGMVGILGTVVSIGFNIALLAIFQFGIKGYLISYLIMNVTCAIILFLFGELYNYISFEKRDKHFIKEMLDYTIPLIPNRINWWIIMMFNRYIIGYYFGSSKVGVFTAANRIPSIITAVYGVVQQALLLSVIDEYESENNYETFIKTYKTMNTVLIIAVLLLNILSTQLSNFLFANEYYEAYKVAPLLVVSVLFGSLHGNLTTFFSANKNTKLLFYNSLIGVILTVALNMILVPIFGVYGAAISCVLAYFSVWLHLFIQCNKEIAILKSLRKDIICYVLVVLQSVSIIKYNLNVYYLISIIIVSAVSLLKKKEVLLIFLLLKKVISNNFSKIKFRRN